MAAENKQQRLRRIPSVTALLQTEQAAGWVKHHPVALVTQCLREAAARARHRALENDAIATEPASLLAEAAQLLAQTTAPRLRAAINATGIILHTGLGRAVFPATVVESVAADLKGYTTLAVDRETGDRLERDELTEGLLRELTGAEAATVVNNNAAATMLVLAALAAHKEVIVSRGQLIEIGGSFRLPEVMVQSQARLVEVGATNRTHLKDYERAVTPETAAIMRVHPSNYRIVGFAGEPKSAELAELAHRRGLIFIDDLGAGALVDLAQFGLPHEPTAREAIAAGADVILFSGDKLIGGSQAGIIAGRKDLIDRLRKHPLMRALRADKTCLMVLERTLALFRDPARLRQESPTYRMLCAPLETLRARAQALVAALAKTAPRARAAIDNSVAYLGSGSLPTQAIPSLMVSVAVPGLSANALAQRLRLDPACVFGRIEEDCVRLDMRTLTDAEAQQVAEALGRIAKGAPSPQPSPPGEGARSKSPE